MTGLAFTPAIRQVIAASSKIPKCKIKIMPIMPTQPARSGFEARRAK